MEYSPPPLFKQGASARAKAVFFALIALALLVVDSRMQTLSMVRRVVGTVLYPLQMTALMPRDALYKVGGYFRSLSSVEAENAALKKQRAADAQSLQQSMQYAAENAQLRRLLQIKERTPAKAVTAEILYDARDAFTRKVVLDRGTQHGVALGQPVIDDIGIVGQVTRVFPFTSEVTLLTDKDQAIPVQILRNGLRSVAYGRGQSGYLDLRFMPANADIQKGDVLITSGIDGLYPPGLAVAKVVQIENKSTDAFARIVCLPAAGIDRNKQLLIIEPQGEVIPRPAPEFPEKKDKASRKRAQSQKEGAKEAAKEAPGKEVPGKAKTADKEAGAKAVAKPEVQPNQSPSPAAAAPKPAAPLSPQPGVSR